MKVNYYLITIFLLSLTIVYAVPDVILVSSNIDSGDYYNQSTFPWGTIAGNSSLSGEPLWQGNYSTMINKYDSLNYPWGVISGNSSTAGNLSWNETYANTLYAAIGTGGNMSWNETYANTLYEPIGGGSGSESNNVAIVNNLLTSNTVNNVDSREYPAVALINNYINYLNNITGMITSNIGFSVDTHIGITDTTSYWLCTAADCSTTCQTQIHGGIITGCV